MPSRRLVPPVERAPSNVAVAEAAAAHCVPRPSASSRLPCAFLPLLAAGAIAAALAGASPALADTTTMPLTTVISTYNPNQPTTIVSSVMPATSTSNTGIPSTFTSSINSGAFSAISSAASSTMPTVIVSTFNPNMPTTFTSTINPAATSYNPYNPYTIVSTINPAAPNRIVTTINPTTLDTIAANVQPFSPNVLTTTTNTSTGTTTTTISPANGSSGNTNNYNNVAYAQNSQVGTAAGQASIRAGRTVSETLSDRNEDTVQGDGTLVQPATEAAPSSVRSYAPMERLQAYFPSNVLKPGPEAFTPKYKVYGTGFGGGFNDSSSLRGDFVGGLVGLDAQVLPNLLVGGAAGGSSTRASLAAGAASANIDGFNGSLYAIGTKGAYYAQSVTTFSAFTNETRRNVAVGPGANEVALFGSFEVRERVEIGRVLTSKDVPSLGPYKIVPFIGFEYANLRLNGHSESNYAGTGTFADLTISGQTVTDLPAFIGARFERTFALGNGMTLTPIVRLAYVHQFADAPVTSSFAAATGATVFASNTTTLGRNAALTKAGAELAVRSNLVVFANFDGLFSGDTSLYGGRAGVRYAF